METQNKPQPQALPNAAEKKPIPDGVLLLLLSAYGYLCAFEHEKGYCEWFGIPESFIRPDLSTFLLAAGLGKSSWKSSIAHGLTFAKVRASMEQSLA